MPISSACFAIGALPGYVSLVGVGADGVTFFVGSIFFTSAGTLQFLEVANTSPSADHRARPFRPGSWEPRRIDWLATLPGLDPAARPERVLAEEGYECWESRGALGYLVLAAIVEAQLASPPTRARIVVARDSAPTGVLGYWARKLAEGGLVPALTATGPPRPGHPDGGPPLAGTTLLHIAIDYDELARDCGPELGRRPGRRRRLHGQGHAR